MFAMIASVGIGAIVAGDDACNAGKSTLSKSQSDKGKSMLYDVRTYICRPGTVKKHLAIYEEYGFEVQRRHLGDPLVYVLTETGNVNSYLHIWVYQDAADRAARRAALQADPGWIKYQTLSGEAGYLLSQQNSLMTEVPFFKLK